MDLILVGIDILLLLAVWQYMVKPTALDHARDKLFDLRDEIRDKHLAEGWGIESAVYGRQRELINAYLLHTKHFSAWRIFMLRLELMDASRRGLRQHLDEENRHRFATSNKAQAAYAQDVHRRAMNVLTEYSVFSNGLLLLLCLMCVPVFAVMDIYKLCGRGVKGIQNTLRRDVHHFIRIFMLVWKQSAAYMGSKMFDQRSIDMAAFDERYRLS